MFGNVSRADHVTGARAMRDSPGTWRARGRAEAIAYRGRLDRGAGRGAPQSSVEWRRAGKYGCRAIT